MEKNAITTIDIDYIANLARIEISGEQKVRFKEQLEGMLDYFQKISALDVTGVEPVAHPFPSYNVWQEDKPTEPFTPKQALQNAPEQRDNQIVVPKVVE